MSGELTTPEIIIITVIVFGLVLLLAYSIHMTGPGGGGR